MEITDVRIRKLDTDGRLKAVVSLTFDDQFVVHDIKVIQGNQQLFVAMPSKKLTTSGEYRDVAHPITTETRNMIRDVVLEAYEKAPTETKPLDEDA
ncbi:MAG: septation regulator SpoVG [Peptostreptococcaceae bacterium]|nr:septation regulator SpoVG [Peptostreptococcaceae bacterium]MDY5738837.1 septation regulator SpoVG [Anaerovoracaceae bacterium]